MAHPSQEISKLRTVITQLSDAQAAAASQLHFIDLLGNGAFVSQYLVDAEGNPTTDITLADFAAGTAALAAVLGGITPAQAAAIAKLRT